MASAAVADALSLRRYGPSPGSHSHEHFQVLLGLEGALELEIEGHGLRITHGSGCVIEPGARHDFESRQGSLCLVLDSAHTGWAACAQQHAMPWPDHARPLAQYLVSALRQGHPLALTHGPALLREAWNADITKPIIPTTPSRRRAIDWQQLAQWAAREWHGSLTVADLAQRVHLSPSQFAARCREELGLSAIGWLRSQRLAQARLLRSRGLSVAEVAQQTGYRSPSALTAALRRETPSKALPSAG